MIAFLTSASSAIEGSPFSRCAVLPARCGGSLDPRPFDGNLPILAERVRAQRRASTSVSANERLASSAKHAEIAMPATAHPRRRSIPSAVSRMPRTPKRIDAVASAPTAMSLMASRKSAASISRAASETTNTAAKVSPPITTFAAITRKANCRLRVAATSAGRRPVRAPITTRAPQCAQNGSSRLDGARHAGQATPPRTRSTVVPKGRRAVGAAAVMPPIVGVRDHRRQVVWANAQRPPSARPGGASEVFVRLERVIAARLLDVLLVLVLLVYLGEGWRNGILRSVSAILGVAAGGIAAFFAVPLLAAAIPSPDWRIGISIALSVLLLIG